MTAKKLICLSLIVCLLLLILASCRMENPVSLPLEDNHAAEPGEEAWAEEGNPKDQLDLLIEKMTLREKIGQLIMVGLDGTRVTQETAASWANYPFGAVILYQRNITSAEQLAAFSAELKQLPAVPYPIMLAVDEEGGRVSRLPEAAYPSAAKQAQMGEQQAFEVACQIGRRLSEMNIDLNFAPVLDINPGSGKTVFGDRSFGSDPGLVAAMGVAFSRGLRESGIIAVGKHFPGHGATVLDSHIDLPVVQDKDWQQLLELEMAPFQAVIADGIPALMTAHITVLEIDDRPATLSPVLLNLLREKMGFAGLIISDDLEMAALTRNYAWDEIVIGSFLAGVDILLIGHTRAKQEEAFNLMEQAYLNQVITDDRLNQSLKRVLGLKQERNAR